MKRLVPGLIALLLTCVPLRAQVSLSTNLLTWEANETDTKYVTVTGGNWECDSLVYSNHFQLNRNSGSSGTSVAITPLSTVTGDTIEGGIGFYNPGTGSYVVLDLIHNGPSGTFSVSPLTLSWGSTETQSQTVTVTGSGWTSSINGSGFSRTENTSGGTITVSPNGQNIGSSARNANLIVSKGDSEKYVWLHQDAGSNNGGNNGGGGNQQPIYHPDYVEWDAGDRTPKTVQVDAIGSWTLTDLTEGGHFYVSPWYGSGSGMVTITPLSENMGYVDMTEDFRFHDSVDTTYVMHLVHKRRFTDDLSDTTNTVFSAITPASVDRLANADSLSSWLPEQSGHIEISGHDVGSIPVVEGVTPTGGVTFSLSIPVAAGYKLTPGVTLAYNSQAGNGLAGYGWDVGGLSAITVIARNRYYHGTNGAAEKDGVQAAWSLDGIPLLENQGPDYAATYPLVTARGRIFAKTHRDTSGIVSHFTVIYPDGTRATYGWSTTTQPQAFYPITEKTDRLGNRITYEYAQPTDGGSEWRITAIRYGYTTGGAPSASVVFGYTGRTDKITKYYAGAKITNGYLLKSIASLSGADTLVRYSLSHKEAEDVNLLEKIECHDGSGHSLPPARFNYITDECDGIPKGLLREYSKTISAPYGEEWNYQCYTRGHFYGGNSTDGIACWPKKERYKNLGNNTFGSGYDGDETVAFISTIKGGGADKITTGAGFQTFEAVDIDGDGADELVKINYGGVQGTNTRVHVTVYEPAPRGNPHSNSFDITILGNREMSIPIYFPDGSFSVIDSHGPSELDYLFGDYDGDGCVDLTILATHSGFNGFVQTPRFAVIDLNAGVKIYEGYLFNHYMGDVDNYRVLCADVDADGRTEIVRISGETPTIEVYGCTSMNGGFSLEHTWNILSSSAWGHHGPYITDVNGDGYLDFVVIPDNGTASAWCYTGTGYEQRTLSGLQLTGSNSYVVFADVNRDGLVDALERLPGSSYMKVALNSNGTSFHSGDVRETEIWMSGDIVPFNIFDTYGTGGVVSIMGRFIAKYGFTRDRSLLRMIRCHSDGTGNVSASGYCNMMVSGEEGVYDEDYSRSYSLSDGYYKVAFPAFLLSSKAGKSSGQTISKARYKYGDAAFHRLGLGFCGFGALTEEDCIRQTATRTMLDPEKFGVVVGRSTVLSGQQTPFSSSSYTYDDHVSIAGKTDPRLTESVETDALTGIAATVSYSYDSYDLPVSTVTERSVNGGDGIQSVTLTGYSNSVSPTLYLLGTPASVIETKGILASKTEYTLDSLKRPTRTKAYIGTIIVSDTTWCQTSDRIVAYDVHGNITSDRTAAYGATTYNESTYTYDNAGRFMTASTDLLGRATTCLNYNKYGQPSLMRDWLNRETTCVYDAWGNLTGRTLPDGTVEQETHSWSASGEPGLYCVSKTVTGQPDTKVWYDALGREVRSANKRFDGSWQYVTTEYDARGRLYRTSLPYKDTTVVPSLWNTYTYDTYNRPISLSEASGKQTTWSYSGTSTTTTKDGMTSTSSTDAEGNVVSVSDAGGTITYTLRDDGQPSSVTVTPDGTNQNIVTSFTYDVYGRRTAIIDPSAGTRTDTYTDNADGTSSIAHTGPNGTVTSYYDRFGRVTSVTRPEFNTSYTYGTTLYDSSYGKLLSETSTNGTSRSFTYDGYGRPITETEHADSTNWLRRTYNYGAGSNVASINYTTQDGSITTESFSYTNGHNTGLTIPGTTVFSLHSENVLGQPTDIRSGGVKRYYSYTTAGIPSRRRILDGQNTVLQDFGYSYDSPTGNLMGRTDVVPSPEGNIETSESFGYDGLNRLESAGMIYTLPEVPTPEPDGPGPILPDSTSMIIPPYLYGEITANYDSKGNILSRGVMNSTYTDVSDPYAMSGAGWDAGGEEQEPYAPGRYLRMTSFDRPSEVGDSLDFSGACAIYEYDASGSKVRATIPAIGIERVYMGSVYEKDVRTWEAWNDNLNDFELRSETIHRLFLGGSAYDAPMVLVKVDDGSWTLYNIGRDVQGSITHIITGDGELLERYVYDPWGCVTMVDSAGNYVDSIAVVGPYGGGNIWSRITGSHGYTGHEHIPGVNLINANARIYDPAIGRFLSPDPLIQDPASTQNLNRYTYCLNNPLKYTDESGEIFFSAAMLTAIGISAIIGGVSGWAIGKANNAQGKNMFGYIAGGVAIGALSALSAGGISAIGGAAWWAGATAGAISGGGFAGLSTNWDSSSILNGAWKGALSGFIGGGVGSAIGGGWGAFFGGGASSGINSLMNGGDIQQVGMAALLGAVLSYGSYEFVSYVSFSNSELEINGSKVSYKQFKTMQADYQRSRFWRKEYGGILTKNGGVVKVGKQGRHNLAIEFSRKALADANGDGGILATYHTHWAKPDVSYTVNEHMDFSVDGVSVPTSNGPSEQDISKVAGFFKGDQFLIDYRNIYMYNTESTYGHVPTINCFIWRFFPIYLCFVC